MGLSLCFFMLMRVLFLLSLFHFVITLCSPSVQPLCHDDERSALLQFKEIFSITKRASFYDPFAYPKVASWKLEGGRGDCCSWDGVECDEDTGHVIRLDLSSSCLYGSINSSSSLFHLVHLQWLSLAHNDFNFSKIPSELGRLSGLTYLNLSYSSFSGQIPAEISKLSKLASLDLSDNIYSSYDGYHGLLELKRPNLRSLVQNLTSLVKLDLRYVNIYSTVPDTVANLSSLKSLILSGCGVHGEFPIGIFQLPKLQILDVSNNQVLIGHLPEFHSSNHLKVLSLWNTSFSGELPFSIGNLVSLTYLEIYGCNFTGSIPSSLGNLTQLTYLDLSRNYNLRSQATSLFNSVGKLTKLNTLALEGMGLNGEIPSSLANLTELMGLFLCYNRLTGQIPFWLSNMPQLVRLQLCANRFTGQIPWRLMNLTHLTGLEMGGNQLTGPIPFQLMNLTQLTILDLSRNKLQGQIPSSISELRRLEYLGLYSNNLSGTVELDMPGQLQGLYLGNNQFTGQIPSTFINLTHLTYLSLSSNKLQGPIPSFISELRNLETLDLWSNNLSGTVELDMFSTLKNLSTLYLSSNHLSLLTKTDTNVTLSKFEYLDLASCNLREFPGFLQSQDKLKWLDLSNNNIHGQIPKWLWNTSRDSLLFMNLSQNFLTGSHQLILPWTSLLILDLRSNRLEGSLPIPSATIGFYLVADNKFTGKVSSWFCNLTSLHVLDLSFNHLNGMLPQCLGNISDSLSVLDLRGNNFHGSIPQMYKTGIRLRMIDLSDNQLEGKLPRSLGNCTRMEYLNFGNNQIVDFFPSWLGTLPELGVLVLRFNKFHGVIEKPKSTFEFSKLRIIDLSHNHFTGKLPSGYFQSWTTMKVADAGPRQYMPENVTQEMTPGFSVSRVFDLSLKLNNKGGEIVYEKILKALSVIDLSNNQFEGEIPDCIGVLKGLRSLNLSNNLLTGCIPSSLGNLSELESLDLSQNQLSGEIPQQLTQLHSLEVFRVSYNHLTGPIPQGNQFNTFPNPSYEGNSGLCGDPLPNKCAISNALPAPPLSESEKDEGFDWKIVLTGYASGFVIGVSIGYMVTTWKHDWFMKTFGRRRQKRRREKRRGHRT